MCEQYILVWMLCFDPHWILFISISTPIRQLIGQFCLLRGSLSRWLFLFFFLLSANVSDVCRRYFRVYPNRFRCCGRESFFILVNNFVVCLRYCCRCCCHCSFPPNIPVSQKWYILNIFRYIFFYWKVKSSHL